MIIYCKGRPDSSVVSVLGFIAKYLCRAGSNPASDASKNIDY